MITSGLISQCRVEYNDVGKSTQAGKNGDGTSTLFNLGRYPIVENSYIVRVSGAVIVETTNFSINLDNGDVNIPVAPGNGVTVLADFKYANFRDADWVAAINYGIGRLNERGFYRQTIRSTSQMRISASVHTYNAPSGCIDLYEFLPFSNNSVSGSYVRPAGNWEYQSDANKVVLKYTPSVAGPVAVSYLRTLQKYNATSATLDVKDDWIELVKKAAGAYFFRKMAAKIATEGNASIDEGHFSFTNLRTMANDLDADFDKAALRAKPTRPAKEIQWEIPGGGQ